MSKESLEHLSSLMDGELSREATLFLSRRLSSDGGLCDTWERYHLIRDCIRQPGSKHAAAGLRSRLSESLNAEQAPSLVRGNGGRWLKPLSGVAIAASVALMAIVFTTPQPAVEPGFEETAAASQPFISPNALAVAPVSQAASYAPSRQTHSNPLNIYLLRHNQMAKAAGRHGFVPFVPIVATQAAVETASPGADEAAVAAADQPGDPETE